MSGLLILLLEFLVKGLSECIEPSIEPVHPYRAQIRLSGTAFKSPNSIKIGRTTAIQKYGI